MPIQGKNIDKARVLVDRTKSYSPIEAFQIAKEGSFAKFDESIDAAIGLSVDPRHADQNVRGSVVLPHGTGKTVRVAVFAKGEKAIEAKEAGAEIVGAEDLVERIQKENFMDFDKVIATPDMMPLVGRIGRTLGPRGLMPNPKTGTVTFDIAGAVSDSKGGKVDFRVDKAGNLHVVVGRKSFTAEQLAENFEALMEKIVRLRPASTKGIYLKNVSISSTMGAGVRVDKSEFK
jgi:large subunit ribosomal protein L1